MDANRSDSNSSTLVWAEGPPTTPTPTPRFAPHPFDKPDADVLIRSCDRVEFRVRSHILLEASPVLAAMLAPPLPPQNPWKKQAIPSSPVLELPEDSKTLETLLRICYPILNPYLADAPPDEVEAALRAAIKYEMALPIEVLTQGVLAIIPRAPLQAWAIACRLRLEMVAAEAAWASLNSLLDFTSLGMMEGISAGDYYRLRKFHRSGGKVDVGFQFLRPELEQTVAALPTAPPPSLRSMTNPDIICRSSDGVEFRVQKSSLAKASPEVLQQIQAAERAHGAALEVESSSSDEDEPPTLPCILLEEKAALVAHLFGFYQLGADLPLPSGGDVYVLADIMVAAIKYGAGGLLELASYRWTPLARLRPLQAYFAAVTRPNLASYARSAAKDTVDLPLETLYTEDLEQHPALPYHRLLTYRNACKRIAKGAIRDVFTRPVDIPVKLGAMTTPQPPPLSSEGVKLYVPANQSVLSLSTPLNASSSSGAGSVQTHMSFQSNSPWLPTYVASVYEAVDSGPIWTSANMGGMVLVEATRARTAWCDNCQLLADDLLKLRSGLYTIWYELNEVVLEI